MQIVPQLMSHRTPRDKSSGDSLLAELQQRIANGEVQVHNNYVLPAPDVCVLKRVDDSRRLQDLAEEQERIANSEF